MTIEAMTIFKCTLTSREAVVGRIAHDEQLAFAAED